MAAHQDSSSTLSETGSSILSLYHRKVDFLQRGGRVGDDQTIADIAAANLKPT